MDKVRWNKITGVGPTGALISIALAVILWGVDGVLGHPEILRNPAPLKAAGVALILAGLALHGWSYWTLRSWWDHDQLCTQGPFRYFRHPMYAAWITLMVPGFLFWLNSVTLLLWIPVSHPVWHWLVRREERTMMEVFGQRYRDYAARTGRFSPRITVVR